MLSNVASTLIERYGSADTVCLVRTSTTYDPDTMENATTTSKICLTAYISKLPLEQETDGTTYKRKVKVMAKINDVFDGTISAQDTIEIGGIRYDIMSDLPEYLNGKKTYVELICGG